MTRSLSRWGVKFAGTGAAFAVSTGGQPHCKRCANLWQSFGGYSWAGRTPFVEYLNPREHLVLVDRYAGLLPQRQQFADLARQSAVRA